MKSKLLTLTIFLCLVFGLSAHAADGEWFFRNNVSNDARFIELHMLGAHDAFTASLNASSEVDAAGVKLGDSGSKGAQSSWGTAVINASKAQSADVVTMLNSGVRYFDVRLSRYKDDGEFYTVHGRISDKFTGDGGIARQIAAWAAAHPGELIVMDFQSLFDIQTDNGGATQQSWRDLMTKLTADGITQYVTTSNGSISSLTYGGLTNNGSRPAIVLFGQVTGTWADSRLINRRDDDGYMRSYHTEKESYNDLRSALAQEYSSLMDANRDKYYYRFRVMQAQTTPGLLSILFGRANLINDANTNNIKILTDPDYDKWSEILPVLMVDNATSDSGDFNALAIEKLAKKNREYTPEVYRAVSGNVTLIGSNDNVPLGASFNAIVNGETLTLGGEITGEMTVIIRSSGKVQRLYRGDDLLGETGSDGLLKAQVNALGEFRLVNTDEDVDFSVTRPLLWYNFTDDNGLSDISGSGLDGLDEGSPNIGGGSARLTPGSVVKLPAGLTKHMAAYTVTAWVNLNSASSNTRFFDIGRHQRANVFGEAGTDKTSSGMKNENTIRAQGGGLTVGKWAHLAAQYRNGTLTLYVNGQKVTSNTTSDPAPNLIDDYFNPNGSFIGRTMWYAFGEAASDNPDINAQIADFRIYDTDISAEEIARLARTPQMKFIDIDTGKEIQTKDIDVPTAYSGVTFPEIKNYIFISSENITDMAGSAAAVGYYKSTLALAPDAFSVKYEDGTAVITAPQSGTYTVVFAAYKDDTLISLELRDVTFEQPGELIVSHTDIQTDGAYTLKVMLWSSLNDIKPLCSATK